MLVNGKGGHMSGKRFHCLSCQPPFSVCAGTLDRITPHGVRMLRAMVNDSVLDVMYYLSLRFGPEVCVCVCV